jgi:hypothetical protein
MPESDCSSLSMIALLNLCEESNSVSLSASGSLTVHAACRQSNLKEETSHKRPNAGNQEILHPPEEGRWLHQEEKAKAHQANVKPPPSKSLR